MRGVECGVERARAPGGRGARARFRGEWAAQKSAKGSADNSDHSPGAQVAARGLSNNPRAKVTVYTAAAVEIKTSCKRPDAQKWRGSALEPGPATYRRASVGRSGRFIM
eukprot:2506255-Pyramimonas_sp.AAC.1